MNHEIITHVLAAIAGAFGGSLVTFKITKSKYASHGGTNVDQSGSKVKGDQIGGSKFGS